MSISSKRAEYVAITALVVNLVFFAGTLVIGAVTGAFAVLALAWQILGATGVWFVLIIVFHQHSLAEQEKLDITELTEAQKAGTIFQAGADRTALFAVAQKRLVVLEKWFVPIFGVIISIYQMGIGLLLESNHPLD